MADFKKKKKKLLLSLGDNGKIHIHAEICFVVVKLETS